MLNIPVCALPSDEYRKFTAYTRKCATELARSCSETNIAFLEKCNVLAVPFIDTAAGDTEEFENEEFKEFFSELDDTPFAGDSRWCNRKFGAVNTVQNSACIAFVIKSILDYFGKSCDMEEIFVALEEGGYRKWKLANNARTLSTPKLDVESIKKEFPSDDPIQDCTTLEEIYALYGEPVGIGGAAIAIDNILKTLSKNDESEYNTRIFHPIQIIENLRRNFLVPMRVNNAIYHADPKRKGGHYVILLGMIRGTAFVIDSSERKGIRDIPVQQLMNAALKDENLIAVWDLSSCC